MAIDPDKTVRKVVYFPKELWAEVETFQHDREIATEAKAVRKLVEIGLQAIAGGMTGEQVKAVRQKLRMNLAEFGDSIGIPATGVMRIETGTISVRANTAAKIWLLAATLNDKVEGDDEIQPDSLTDEDMRSISEMMKRLKGTPKPSAG